MAFDIDRMYAELERHESLRTHVYDDATGKRLQPGEKPKGHPTIGIGRNLRARPLTDGEKALLRENRPDLGERDLFKDGITEEEAWYLASNDVRTTTGELDKRLPWWRNLSEVRQRAVVNMAFNMGVDGLLGFRKMLAAMQAGNFDRAAQEAIRSDWSKQVKATRANDIARMIQRDVAPTIRDGEREISSAAPEPLEQPVQVASLDPMAGFDQVFAQPAQVMNPEHMIEAIEDDPNAGAEALAMEVGMEDAGQGGPSEPPGQPSVALPARGRPVVPGNDAGAGPFAGPE